MIASLRGTVSDMGAGFVVIECAGVGHLLQVTPKTQAQLTRGEEGFVLTTLIVREDAMTLYGFTNAPEREMFDLLQTVSGLGPRIAMAVLTVLSPSEIAHAVMHGDAKRLQAANGVGKRMAERMLVELKGKVDVYVDASASSADANAEGQTPRGAGVALAADIPQVVAALVGLGFKEDEAQVTVEAVVGDDATMDTSAALRASLKVLGR
ncbi:Holliday junction branch migration protein RuvA [Corynebacterium sp. H78]|uniref:Holliday junction branch migration protein RuvA n=1 Tax=Corynebacterium sp. H78 TaxID=3133417 RepID=UPI0030A70E50